MLASSTRSCVPTARSLQQLLRLKKATEERMKPGAPRSTVRLWPLAAELLLKKPGKSPR